MNIQTLEKLIRFYTSLKEADTLYRNRNVNIAIFLLFCLLIILIVNVFLHVKIYIVYSSGIGPLFVIGLVIFLIVLFYYKG